MKNAGCTRNKDKTVKRELYEQQGVQYYFLADAVDQSIEALKLVESVYMPMRMETECMVFDLDDDCRIELPLSAIFPR